MQKLFNTIAKPFKGIDFNARNRKTLVMAISAGVTVSLLMPVLFPTASTGFVLVGAGVATGLTTGIRGAKRPTTK